MPFRFDKKKKKIGEWNILTYILLSFLLQNTEGTISLVFFFACSLAMAPQASCFWYVSPGVSRCLAVSRCNSARVRHYVPNPLETHLLHCFALLLPDDLLPLARLSSFKFRTTVRSCPC
ncbi:hypothetical protein EDB92DRAFT_283023 [Lactarius akahatsu]|uniref:Uncharacterized protein n=1 Tax=Lactarius akahatsu TaxID=416441 RepID=A0AAD4LN66_9AGAM|nr:hypothetical protein EDB92DRAFT_283023 [Lactarius akahatsu]